MVDLSETAIEISDADSYPVPDPIDDQKDVTNEVEDPIPEISEELDQEAEITTSSDLNNVDKDEVLTNSNKKSDQSEHDPSKQDKVLKRPDKILPCPRCKSSNTKFCYYNNYNVSQPRHFCKNCQRYWTSGGTMRNVPVGSGKRKSKQSSNVSTPMQPPMQNEILLKLGENCNELPSSSSDLCEPEAPKEQNGPLPMHPLQGLPGTQWPYPWGPVPWGLPMMFPAPALCPFPIMPAFFYYPSLGKHSRDGNNLQGEEKIEKRKNLWVPKTLRIDDPEEAAKSSIWSTLGIKRDQSIKRGSLFRGFNSNNEIGGFSSDSARVLHANPAALARSQTFQEIS